MDVQRHSYHWLYPINGGDDDDDTLAVLVVEESEIDFEFTNSRT